MTIALLTRRGKFYKTPGPQARLGQTYQNYAQFYSLMNGEVYARDIVGGNNLAPVSGSDPTTVIRSWGKSLNFNGSSQYLITPQDIPPLSTITVMAWVRPAALNTTYARIAETDYASNFYLGSNTGSKYAWITNNASLEGCIGGQQVAGQRDFLAGTYDGTNRNLYVNGVQVASAAATAPAFKQILFVGRSAQGPAGYWNGDIDNVAIFNHAFSASTIFQIYQDQWRIFESPKRFIGGNFSAGSGTTGSVAYTNANDTVSASGTAPVVGTLARTNANDTVSASGTTTVTGSLAKTNANDTVVASGSPIITGALARTNANDTVSASGSPIVTGSLAKTNANDSLNASGSVGSGITGSLAYTNNNDTVSAAGTAPVVGTLARTNANDTVSASGTTTVIGSLSKTNANDTSTGAGTTTVTGSLAKTNANDTCAASGTVTAASVTGSLAYTNRNDTSAAAGTTTINASLAYTNNNDRLSAFGTINNGIVFESDLMTGQPVSTAIKKPGIPSGTPDWEKTMFEILTGRRGNAITIPAKQDLTFSSTPTQAECQSLLAYTNTMRDALDQLITRFDS
jgi:hypothetical protein